MPTNRWQANERVLAEALPENVMEAVAKAYNMAEGVRLYFRPEFNPEGGEPMDDAQLKSMKDLAVQAVTAMVLLRTATPLKD